MSMKQTRYYYSRSLFSADLHSAAFCKILIQSCIVRKIKENLKKIAQCGIFSDHLGYSGTCIVRILHSAENFAFWTLWRTIQGPTVLISHHLNLFTSLTSMEKNIALYSLLPNKKSIKWVPPSCFWFKKVIVVSNGQLLALN